MGSKDNVVYSGTGQLTFGAAEDATDGKEKFFKGRMLQGRLWYRAMDLATLNRYSGRLLTGYEMGLADYYPMNDGTGDYAADLAQGAHLMLSGASWAQPEGMSLRIDNSDAAASTDQNMTISSTDDWNTFCTMVSDAKGQYNVNAELLADITVTKIAGYNSAEAYRGTFEGNGHTLTLNIKDNANNTALFSHAATATLRNLNVDRHKVLRRRFATVCSTAASQRRRAPTLVRLSAGRTIMSPWSTAWRMVHTPALHM